MAEMDGVYRMAMHLTRHPDEAQDLVQETYLKAFRSWHTFKPPIPPGNEDNHPSDPADGEAKSKTSKTTSGGGAGGNASGGGGGMRPWLFKILHNTFFTKRKKALREPTMGDDFPDPAGAGRVDEPEPAWDLASLDWEHVDDRLKKAIEDLPEHYREVLLLWAVEGLKYREVAEVLGVALGTVMSRLYRARSILSQSLSELAAEHGIRT